MNMKRKILIKISIILFLIFTLIFIIMAIPDGVKASGTSPEKYCASNIRVLHGAIEMYYLDNSIYFKEFNNEILNILKNQKYLKDDWPYKKYTNSNKCKYLYTGDLSKDGIIYCEYHGGADPIGKIKPSREYEKDEQIKSIKKFFYRFEWLIYIFTCLIIITIFL